MKLENSCNCKLIKRYKSNERNVIRSRYWLENQYLLLLFISHSLLISFFQLKQRMCQGTFFARELQSSNFLTASCYLSPYGQPHFVEAAPAYWTRFGPFWFLGNTYSHFSQINVTKSFLEIKKEWWSQRITTLLNTYTIQEPNHLHNWLSKKCILFTF